MVWKDDELHHILQIKCIFQRALFNIFQIQLLRIFRPINDLSNQIFYIGLA